MPALPSVPTVIRVRLLGNTSTAPWVNVLHLQYTGPQPASTTLDNVCSQIGTAWAQNMAPMFTSAATLTGVDAVDLSSASGAYGSGTFAHVGTRAGASNPINVAAVVSWKVNYRWRGGHGRTYFAAGVATDIVTGRLWTGTFQTAYDAAATAFWNAINAIASGGSTFKLVIVRYYQDKQLLQNPLVLLVTDVIIHERVDTQRRRLGREFV